MNGSAKVQKDCSRLPDSREKEIGTETKKETVCFIRKLEPSDEDREACLLQLAELDERIFPKTPWGLDAFRENLKNGYDSLFLAFSGRAAHCHAKESALDKAEGTGGSLCGFALLRKLDVSELLLIGTAQEARRKGIGQRLLSEALSEACGTSVLLEVREHNEPALRLYRRMGFQEYRRRRNYYTAPKEDAVLMIREPQE